LFILLLLISSAAGSSTLASTVIPVQAPRAMVASVHKLASRAGVQMMRAGGNAVDAAVAVGFALAVVHPQAGNLGGGGFMLIRMADGKTHFVDYREKAPAAATANMYLDAQGNVIEDASIVGYKAIGVPGSVAGMVYAERKYGKLSLEKVMAPAIKLAEEGIWVDSGLSRGLGTETGRIGAFSGKALFFPGGKALAPGARLVQKDLARTLRLIAANGAKAFYEGAIADSIAAEERRGGGIITKDDLKRYKPEWRTPIQSTYASPG
jgi:gamma-glutamyltranspeptidase/glutathione hydrolase